MSSVLKSNGEPVIPLFVPASLATEPIGGFFAGSLQCGEPVAPRDTAGYILVRFMHDDSGMWFEAEATYDGATRYVEAIADCHRARHGAGGPYRRIVTVSNSGTFD